VENLCHFSPDRRHRYALIHRWNPLFSDRSVLRIGLNPSTANEDQLDPTLTRIAAFSKREGFDRFWMAKLFGLRTPDPKEVKIAQGKPRGIGQSAPTAVMSLHPNSAAAPRWAMRSARGWIGQCFLLAEAARGAHGPPFDPTKPKQASGYRTQRK